MLKKPNHLASLTERTKAISRLPTVLLNRYTKQQELTHSFMSALSDTLLDDVLTACTVASYEQGRLTIATSNQTLVSHLTYLAPSLVSVLSTHHDFLHITSLLVIYVKPIGQT